MEKKLPIEINQVTEYLYARIGNSHCWLCFNPMNVKIGDYIARKHTRKSRYAHIPCAIQKNWIEKKDIDKLYLVPKVRNLYGE